MSVGAITRRSLLAAGAGAAAGAMLHPERVLAALGGVPPTLTGVREVGALAPGATATVRLASVADLLGLQWRSPAGARPQVRYRDRGKGWSAWVPAGSHGHGPEARPGPAENTGDPVWTGGTRELQVRAGGGLQGLRVHVVDVSGGIGARTLARSERWLARAAALPLTSVGLAAGPGEPAIIARRAWAAGVSPPSVAPEYGAVHMAFVHHTENPNGYTAAEVPAMLRAIYAFHRFVNGWDDIGYNFVIDLFGRVFEARAGGIDEPVVGAHAGGYNLVSSGIAVLGSFMSTPISPPARSALERLLAWKLSLHGVPALGRVTVRVNPAGARYSRFPAGAHVSLPRIAGHRDGDSTDCPGDVLYGELSSIRSRVRVLAPDPVLLTLALLPSPPPPAAPAPPTGPGEAPGASGAPAGTPPLIPPPGSSAPVSGALAGALTLASGQPISQATVLLQQRSVAQRGQLVTESTVAQALTDANGRFSFPGPYTAVRRHGVALRAVYQPQPAPPVPAGQGVAPGPAPRAGASVSAPVLVAPPAPTAPLLSPGAASAPSA